jgi:hypothetical protein
MYWRIRIGARWNLGGQRHGDRSIRTLMRHGFPGHSEIDFESGIPMSSAETLHLIHGWIGRA